MTNCICCGVLMESGDWCSPCFIHVIPPTCPMPKSWRTYAGQTGMVCPFDEKAGNPIQLSPPKHVCTPACSGMLTIRMGDTPAVENSGKTGWQVAPHICNEQCRGVDNHADTEVESQRESEKEKHAEEADQERERETGGQWGPQGDPIPDGDPGAQPGG